MRPDQLATPVAATSKLGRLVRLREGHEHELRVARRQNIEAATAGHELEVLRGPVHDLPRFGQTFSKAGAFDAVGEVVEHDTLGVLPAVLSVHRHLIDHPNDDIVLEHDEQPYVVCAITNAELGRLRGPIERQKLSFQAVDLKADVERKVAHGSRLFGPQGMKG